MSVVISCGSSCFATKFNASMTGLPVTRMFFSSIPSRSKFAFDHSVGAKCRSAMTVAMRRLSSSGNGCHLLCVRRPASTCPNFDAAIVGQQRRCDDGRGIAYHEHPVWLKVCQNGIKMGKDGRADLCQGLVITHQVQVIVWLDLEEFQHLIEHLPVLCCDADTRFHFRRFLQQLAQSVRF